MEIFSALVLWCIGLFENLWNLKLNFKSGKTFTMLWKKLIALDLLVGHDNEYNQNKNSHVK